MELLSWLNFYHNFYAMKNAVTWSNVMVLLLKPGRQIPRAMFMLP